MVLTLAAALPPRNDADPFGSITLRWSNLADRRVSYYIELYQSGRWRHYFDERQFLDRMLDVKKAAALWDDLARKQPGCGNGVAL